MRRAARVRYRLNVLDIKHSRITKRLAGADPSGQARRLTRAMKETAGSGPAASPPILVEETAKALRELRQAAHLSQRALAERAGVSEALISHLETGRKRFPRAAIRERVAQALNVEEAELFPVAQYQPELSLGAAKRRTGISFESLRYAIASERLPARFARTGGPAIGNPWRWIIDPADLDDFVKRLKPCRYPGCTAPGVGPTGCCSGPHAQGVAMRGKKRPGIGPKVSSALKGVKRGPHKPERSARIRAGLRRFYSDGEASAGTRAIFRKSMSDPEHQFAAEMGRWGSKGPEYAKRAAAKLAYNLRRRRGGAPPKVELHARWLRMFEAREDLELEELIDGAGGSRARAIAFLDWQRHPHDWPRDKYPASRRDPHAIDPHVLRPAKQRVEKALQRARTKPPVR